MRSDGLQRVSKIRARLLLYWVHVTGDADGCGDDDEVFNDVLTNERGDEKRRPCCAWEKEERKCGGDHVHEKKRDDDACYLFEKKEDADAHFEYAKEDEKRSEVHEVNSGFKK